MFGQRKNFAVVLAIFVAVYASLNLAYFSIPDAWLRNVIYLHALLSPCKHLLELVYGPGGVSIADSALVSQKAYVAVVRGCDGAGLLFLVTAAIACFPSSLKMKLLGGIGAVLLLHVLNVLRIAGLFIVFAEHRTLFDQLHNLIIPTALLLVSGAYFMWWIERCSAAATQLRA
jgi:exosortase family protein XrtM